MDKGLRDVLVIKTLRGEGKSVSIRDVLNAIKVIQEQKIPDKIRFELNEFRSKCEKAKEYEIKYTI